ncbi:MAG: pyridoxamine 5'-phosphate oxidase family protein, partial [Clostridia bacterium]|nr:pyridoxamine 5'-phosphate oxidase family protein [Clostridia bacterium]
GRVKPIDDLDQVIDICRKLSYKYTNDDSFIEGEIKTFGRATLCYEMEIEHMCGKLVNES